MARASTVVLHCLWAPVALAACEPARESHAMPRAETAIVAAQRPPRPARRAEDLDGEAQAPVTGLPPAPPIAAAPSGEPRAPFRALTDGQDAWQKRLRAVPELSRYASRFVPFDAKASDEALRRGDRSRNNIDAWKFANGPFAWSPALRTEYVVLSGSVGERALVAVLEVAGGGQLRHAASLLIDEKDTTVALGTSPENPAELLWTTCYGCPGEGGSILLGDDGRPRFVYR